MIEKDYISNASMIQELARTGNFDKYGIKTREELDLLIETIPKEFIHIRSALVTAWEFKKNNSDKSLFEIRNRLQTEIKYLDIHSSLLRKNVNIDYTKLRENIYANELDGFVEVVTQSTPSNDEMFKGLIRKDNKEDYFHKISSINRVNTIRSSFEEQIRKIDNAINRNVYNKARSNTR